MSSSHNPQSLSQRAPQTPTETPPTDSPKASGVPDRDPHRGPWSPPQWPDTSRDLTWPTYGPAPRAHRGPSKNPQRTSEPADHDRRKHLTRISLKIRGEILTETSDRDPPQQLLRATGFTPLPHGDVTQPPRPLEAPDSHEESSDTLKDGPIETVETAQGLSLPHPDLTDFQRPHKEHPQEAPPKETSDTSWHRETSRGNLCRSATGHLPHTPSQGDRKSFPQDLMLPPQRAHTFSTQFSHTDLTRRQHAETSPRPRVLMETSQRPQRLPKASQSTQGLLLCRHRGDTT